MNHFVYAYLLACLLFFTQNADAKCHRPEQGPPGPEGPPGSLVTHYASAAANIQPFLNSGTHDINFPNSLVTPVGITHPFVSDSDFLVENSGIYQISWTVIVEFDSRARNAIELTLYDVTASTPILPNPVSWATFDDNTGSASNTRYITLSGQTLISLTANTAIRLQITCTNATTTVRGGIFTITNIAM